MDDRMNSTTKGDSLIRKIDFKYDHFLSAYGDGDGNNTKIQAVANPQITRRVETVAVPQWSFAGALTATAGFNGPGSAGVVDSYDSKNGAYYLPPIIRWIRITPMRQMATWPLGVQVSPTAARFMEMSQPMEAMSPIRTPR
jgi:hypothetical protein